MADDTVVFRSDVSLVRVDVQVLDRDNRTVTGLRADDFVLRDEGRVQAIRNFANENMPVDVLLLFDVSASMGPHVRRIANAAHQAMDVLTDKDRVGIMVFDRQSRVRLPFNGDRNEVERALDKMLRDEHFSGGTDITRAMFDAAEYAGSHGRRDARRAIVILTDDQTEFDRSEEQVGRALVRADAVMMALIAPDALANRGYGGNNGGGGYPGGGRSQGGISIGIPGMGYPGGGRRGGNGYPNGQRSGPRTKSAGTAQIARDSGGDSFPVEDASALETTLSRIRQRYALYFLVPPGARQGQERNIDVALADGVRRRYADSDLRYRRTYISPGNGSTSSDTTAAAPDGRNSDPVVISPSSNDSGIPRRRRAVSEPDGRGGPSGAPATAADSTPIYTDSSSSDTPRLRRAPDADSDRDPDRPVMRRAPSSSGSGSSDDPDRPVMRRAPSSGSDSSSDSDRPTLKRADPSSGTSTTPATTKPADPNAPVDPNAPPTGWRKVKPGEQQQQQQ